ncbi:MAG: NAD(P)-dependent oxidoreductase [Polaromonas sp.]|nr:NAD(P)-dependent oxidoreductase [Polaromonas sp.]MDP3751176.1 NAD(P)-dependent oxidoreductase [Polaromonas sp.]
MNQVTLIGAGNMGGAMAANLLERGWTVEVCDIDPVRVQSLVPNGALALSTPAQAAINSVAFIVCVVDAAQTAEVLFGEHGLHQMLQSGHTVVLCPTMAPQDVETFASRLAALGVGTIDAPMSGGPARARDGSMSLMVACPAAVYAQQADLLQALSAKVFRISERPGDGARTKLVNNLLAGINLVGAAEVLALAGRLGLDPGRTLDVIEQSSGQSWIGSDRMRRAIAGDFAPRAHVTLLEKDTRLAVEAARASGMEGPLGVHASAVFAAAHQAGLAELDDAAIYRFLSGKRPSGSPGAG